MGDPLSLLREYVRAKRPIARDGDDLVFGSKRLPVNTKTRAKKGTGDVYTLGALWFVACGPERYLRIKAEEAKVGFV